MFHRPESPLGDGGRLGYVGLVLGVVADAANARMGWKATSGSGVSPSSNPRGIRVKWVRFSSKVTRCSVGAPASCGLDFLLGELGTVRRAGRLVLRSGVSDGTMQNRAGLERPEGFDTGGFGVRRRNSCRSHWFSFAPSTGYFVLSAHKPRHPQDTRMVCVYGPLLGVVRVKRIVKQRFCWIPA